MKTSPLIIINVTFPFFPLKKHCQFNLDPTEAVVASKTGVQFEMEPISLDMDEMDSRPEYR